MRVEATRFDTKKEGVEDVEPFEEGYYAYVCSLGEGSYGSVLLCRERFPNQAQGKLVAIKSFKWAHTDKLGLRLCLREIRVLKSLQHPLVITLERAFRSRSGRIYAVFPFIEGGCGQRLLQTEHPSGLPPDKLKLFAWQLCAAVRYLHSEQVLHRDIKPSNVLFSLDGTIRLCDFGFARSCRSNAVGCAAAEAGADRLTSYVQTRAYRAPEVLLGQPYGAPADIWAIGATVAEMATGKPLLPGTSSLDQLWRVLAALPGPRPAAISAAVDALHRLDPSQVDGCVTAEQLRPKELPGVPLREALAGLDPGVVQLVEACLRLEPAERASADELLGMPWFDDVWPAMSGKPALQCLYEAEVPRPAAPAPASSSLPAAAFDGGASGGGGSSSSVIPSPVASLKERVMSQEAVGVTSPGTPPAPRRLPRVESSLPACGSLALAGGVQEANRSVPSAAASAEVRERGPPVPSRGGGRAGGIQSAFAGASLPFGEEQEEAGQSSAPRLTIASPPSSQPSAELPTPQPQPAVHRSHRRCSSTAASDQLPCLPASGPRGPAVAASELRGDGAAPQATRHAAAAAAAPAVVSRPPQGGMGPTGRSAAQGPVRRPSLPGAAAQGAAAAERPPPPPGLRRVTTLGNLDDTNLLQQAPRAQPRARAGAEVTAEMEAGAWGPDSAGGRAPPPPPPSRAAVRQRGLRSAASLPAHVPLGPPGGAAAKSAYGTAGPLAPGAATAVSSGLEGWAPGQMPMSPRPSAGDFGSLAEIASPTGLPVPTASPGASARAPPHVRAGAAAIQDLIRLDELSSGSTYGDSDGDNDSDCDSITGRGGNGLEEYGTATQQLSVRGSGAAAAAAALPPAARRRWHGSAGGRATVLGYVNVSADRNANLVTTLPLRPSASAGVIVSTPQPPATTRATAAAVAAVAGTASVVKHEPPRHVRHASLDTTGSAFSLAAASDNAPAGAPAARTSRVQQVQVAPASTAVRAERVATEQGMPPSPPGRQGSQWRRPVTQQSAQRPALPSPSPPATQPHPSDGPDSQPTAAESRFSRATGTSTTYGSTSTMTGSVYGSAYTYSSAYGSVTGFGCAAEGCAAGACVAAVGAARKGGRAPVPPYDDSLLSSPRASSDARMEAVWADFSLTLRSTPPLGGKGTAGEARSAGGSGPGLAHRLRCAVMRLVSCGGAPVS